MSPDADDTSGKYVESVDIAGGTMLVTYGSRGQLSDRRQRCSRSNRT